MKEIVAQIVVQAIVVIWAVFLAGVFFVYYRNTYRKFTQIITGTEPVTVKPKPKSDTITGSSFVDGLVGLAIMKELTKKKK